MLDRNTYTRSARAKDVGIKKNFTGMSLVWKTWWLTTQGDVRIDVHKRWMGKGTHKGGT